MNENDLRKLLTPYIGKNLVPQLVDKIVEDHKKTEQHTPCAHGWNFPNRPCPYCQQEQMDDSMRSMFVQSFRDADLAFERNHPEAARRAKEPLTEQDKEIIKRQGGSVSGIDPKWTGDES